MSDRLPPLPSSVNLDQLLGIWGDLVSAYCGANRYGGHVTEIYAYRLLRFDPKIVHEGWAKQVRHEQALEACESFLMIVKRFEQEWDCRCQIDGVWTDEWAKRNGGLFDHRCHVEVIQNEE